LGRLQPFVGSSTNDRVGWIADLRLSLDRKVPSMMRRACRGRRNVPAKQEIFDAVSASDMMAD
jgi:hypothetical protein